MIVNENSNVMGPCLVTPDEIDTENMGMTARINGEIWSDGNVKDMYFKFPQLIAYLWKDDPISRRRNIVLPLSVGDLEMPMRCWLKNCSD
jgi:hypothetical protein